jgi:hypothetical protein
MKPGDMVQIRQQILTGGKKALEFYGKDYLNAMVDVRGIIIKDHSPVRPPEVNRIVDVMWDTGYIEEDIFSEELEVVSETR